MDGKKEDIARLEHQTLAPEFWNDQTRAKKVQKELGQLQDLIANWEKNFNDLEETDMLLDMAGRCASAAHPDWRPPPDRFPHHARR